MSRYDWLIGVCNTNEDGVFIYRFYGTKDDVKQKLIEMIAADRKDIEEEGYDEWECGTEQVEYVEERGMWELYAYGNYRDYHGRYEKSNFHIDYSAIEFAHVDHVFLEEKS